MTIPAHVQSLCDEFGVIIVPKNRVPRIGETRAVGTIQKLIDRRGIDDARLVMRTLLETENMRIPTLSGRAFQPEAGHRSDVKPATIPINIRPL